MTKKNGDDDRADKRVIREDDPSLTESFAGEAMESINDLLGAKELKPKENMALIRFVGSRLGEDLLRTLKITRAHGFAPLVAGPFKLKDIEEWSESGVLVASDMVMTPFRRWLPASECFDVFQKPEMTSTVEHGSSFTLSGSKTMEMTDAEIMKTVTDHDGTALPLESPLEIEDVVKVEAGVRVSRSVTEVVSLPLSKPVGSSAIPPLATPVKPPTSASRVEKPSLGAPTVTRSVGAWAAAAIFLVLLFFSVKALMRRQATGVDGPRVLTTIATPAQNLDLSADWPEWMRPLNVEALLGADDAVMKRLAPIIERSRYGSYDFNESELQTLRRLSSPATASWTARKTASNILAVWMGLQGEEKLTQAVEVLRPIYEASPDDFVTVLNLAMLSLEIGDLSGADELAQVALRLCSQSTCWFSNLLMAKVKERLSQSTNAEKFYQAAADDFAEPAVVFGSWAHFLSSEDGGKHQAKAKLMMERALWGDPDRFILSPLPDATGFTLLYDKIATQLPETLKTPSLALSAGQQEFLKWRLAFVSGKTSIRESNVALTSLSSESSPLSQLLSAYLLSLKGDLDAARERLASMLVLIKNTQPAQGWPWTLAGDLQSDRGYSDQALIFYQSALNRSARDRGAVYGLGQLLRRRADYLGARQKFGEAMAMDSQYVLPKLRVSRFDWQRRLRDK